MTLEHETALDGHCTADCVACRAARLERTVERGREKCEEIKREKPPLTSAAATARLILRELERGKEEAPDG